LQNELEQKGFEVFSLDMPNSFSPKIEEWVSYLRENIVECDDKTYFVGHSIGCQTIMRFLEKIHKHTRVAGCAFVAPWLDLIGLDSKEMAIAHPWINSKIDFERVEDHVGKILCLFSEDDPYVMLDESKKFKELLGAEIVIRKNRGHFDNEEKVEEVLHFIK
jgi:predicted alpha/beta hydrolase family esterase